MDIILFYNFNSLIWLTGIVEVVSTCSRQPKLITFSKNDKNNYNVPFWHVFNWKSNKHVDKLKNKSTHQYHYRWAYLVFFLFKALFVKKNILFIQAYVALPVPEIPS